MIVWTSTYTRSDLNVEISANHVARYLWESNIINTLSEKLEVQQAYTEAYTNNYVMGGGGGGIEVVWLSPQSQMATGTDALEFGNLNACP